MMEAVNPLSVPQNKRARYVRNVAAVMSGVMFLIFIIFGTLDLCARWKYIVLDIPSTDLNAAIAAGSATVFFAVAFMVNRFVINRGSRPLVQDVIESCFTGGDADQSTASEEQISENAAELASVETQDIGLSSAEGASPSADKSSSQEIGTKEALKHPASGEQAGQSSEGHTGPSNLQLESESTELCITKGISTFPGSTEILQAGSSGAEKITPVVTKGVVHGQQQQQKPQASGSEVLLPGQVPESAPGSGELRRRKMPGIEDAQTKLEPTLKTPEKKN